MSHLLSRSSVLTALVYAGTLTVACSGTGSSVSETGQTEDDLTTAWFATNAPPGSAEEKAILALANDRSMSAKAYVETCGFSQEASAAIVDYRQGDDPVDSSDDRVFATLSQLDELPHTAQPFWSAAVACAKAHYLPSGGPAATFQTCTGTRRFPTTGALKTKSTTRYTYARECDAFGECSAWTLSSERVLSSSDVSLNPSRYIEANFVLGFSEVYQGRYKCREEDKIISAQLDTNGRGSGKIQWSDICEYGGIRGAGGPSSYGTDRAIDIVAGEKCIAFTERDHSPEKNYGTQTRNVYIAHL